MLCLLSSSSLFICFIWILWRWYTRLFKVFSCFFFPLLGNKSQTFLDPNSPCWALLWLSRCVSKYNLGFILKGNEQVSHSELEKNANIQPLSVPRFYVAAGKKGSIISLNSACQTLFPIMTLALLSLCVVFLQTWWRFILLWFPLDFRSIGKEIFSSGRRALKLSCDRITPGKPSTSLWWQPSVCFVPQCRLTVFLSFFFSREVSNPTSWNCLSQHSIGKEQGTKTLNWICFYTCMISCRKGLLQTV